MNYIRCGSEDKLNFLQTATDEQIQAHTIMVYQGRDVCILPSCPRCGSGNHLFKRHDRRIRIFYSIVEQVVKRVQGLLSRWKCPGCNKTATSYPWFALPYKRYTIPTIQTFTQAYIQNQAASYRKILAACPLVYEMPPESDSAREPMMEHSTIHRWISTMGSYKCLVQKATDLILQADPATCLCRDLSGLNISPGKYRTLSRKQTLLTCFHLVHLMPCYEATFQTGIFPYLATQSGYT